MIFSLTMFLSKSELFSSVRGSIADGIRYYNKKNYERAMEKYRLAENDDPSSPEVKFNIGNNYYKMGKYQEAIENFEKATYSKDKKLQKNAYYNIGNSLYKTGKLAEAIQYYKKSLDIDQNDEEARYNLELTQRKLKEQMDKNKQKQNKEQKNQEQNKSQYKKDEQNKDKKDQQDKNKKEDQKQQEKEQDKEDKSKMSKEDAKRILDAFDSEKKPKQKSDMKIPIFGMPEKDW